MKELDLQLIVDAHLREERKERRERRGWYVSELGQCQRGVYLQRLEGAPEYDARKLRLFAVGYVFQEWLVDKVKRAGCEVETEVRVEAPDLHVSGRADLLIKGEDRTLLYEIKTMNSQGFHWRERSGNLALPHHELQVMTYLWLLRDKYPNLEARLCYVSKDDLAVLSVDVPYSEERVARIKEELEVMNRAWETGMPPPPAPAVVFDAERGSWTVNWQAKYCPVHARCTDDEGWLARAESEVKALNRKK